MFRLLNADEIEVRVKQISQRGAVALIYKTARTDMDILDEKCGASGWSCEYSEIHGNLFCGITIDGVTKWDCGIESREDDDGNEKKGEASDAFKRAGFRWGIGRELYTSPFIFLSVKTEKNEKSGRYQLVGYPDFVVSKIGYDDKRRINALDISDEKSGEIVYSFRTGQKRIEERNEEQPDSEFAKAEADKMRGIIINLAKAAGRDEPKARMFAEELVEKATGVFVKFDDMDIGTLTKVKVELAKKIAGK